MRRPGVATMMPAPENERLRLAGVAAREDEARGGHRVNRQVALPAAHYRIAAVAVADKTGQRKRRPRHNRNASRIHTTHYTIFRQAHDAAAGQI